MTDTSSSTDTSYDTSLECFQEYFEEDVSLEDLANMTPEELEAYFETHCAELNESERSEFLAALESDLSELSDVIDGTIHDLEELNTEGQYDTLLAELEEYSELCDTDILDAAEEGFGEYAEENVDLTDGSNYTVTDSDDITNGTTITIDATAAEDESSTLVSDPNPEDWVDTNGDGYGDTDPLVDENGLPTVDTNGDGTINEADLEDSGAAETAPQTISLDLEEGTTLDVASYDETTGELIFRCTREDGTIYYIKVLGVTADCNLNIVLTGANGNLTEATLSTWHENMTKIFFESPTTQASETSIYNLLTGETAEPTDDAFTVINTDSETDNTADVTITAENFEEGRDYTVNCQDGVSDAVNITFPEGTDVTYYVDPNTGALIITATYNGDTITITVNGWQTEADSAGNGDKITIIGSTGTADTVYDSLLVDSNGQPVPGLDSESLATYSDDYWADESIKTLADIIVLDDDVESVADTCHTEAVTANTVDQVDLVFPDDFPPELKDAILLTYDHMTPEDQAAFAEFINNELATVMASLSIFAANAATGLPGMQTTLDGYAQSIYTVFAGYFGSDPEMMTEIEKWLEDDYGADGSVFTAT